MKCIIGATNTLTIADLKILDEDIDYTEHVLSRMTIAPYAIYFFVELLNENIDEIKNIDLNQFHTLYYDSLYMNKGFYRGYLALNNRDYNIRFYAKLLGDDFLNYLSMQLNEKEMINLLESIGLKKVTFVPVSAIESIFEDLKQKIGK